MGGKDGLLSSPPPDKILSARGGDHSPSHIAINPRCLSYEYGGKYAKYAVVLVVVPEEEEEEEEERPPPSSSSSSAPPPPPPPQPVDVRPGQSSVLVRRVGRPRPRTRVEGRRSGRCERRVSPEGVGVGRLAGVLDDVPHPDGLSVFGKEGGGVRLQSRSEAEVLIVLFLF